MIVEMRKGASQEEIDGVIPECRIEGRGCRIPPLEAELSSVLDIWSRLNDLRELSPVTPAEVAGRKLDAFEIELLAEIESEVKSWLPK